MCIRDSYKCWYQKEEDMKKIILLVAAVFILVACKGPMSMVNLGKRTESVGLNPKVQAKDHVMKLKEFKIEDISENLEVGVQYHKLSLIHILYF